MLTSPKQTHAFAAGCSARGANRGRECAERAQMNRRSPTSSSPSGTTGHFQHGPCWRGSLTLPVHHCSTTVNSRVERNIAIGEMTGVADRWQMITPSTGRREKGEKEGKDSWEPTCHDVSLGSTNSGMHRIFVQYSTRASSSISTTPPYNLSPPLFFGPDIQ